MKFKKPYEKQKRQIKVTGESVTKQSHKKECDINQIMLKFQKTGIIEHVNNHSPKYHDVSVNEFQNAMEIVAEASSMFQELPSSIRKKFDNNPENFLEFVQNPENEGKLVELGMAHIRPKEDEPLPVMVVNKEAAETASKEVS